jgi:hypothetical protein
MERLRERSITPGSLEAEASELLRAQEPYVPPAGLKRRVRERLVQGRPKRWLPVLLRPALVAACSLLAVGALAAVGGAALAPRERPGRTGQAPVAARLPSVPERSQAQTRAPVLPSAATDDPSEDRPAPAFAPVAVGSAAPVPPMDARRPVTERAEHAAEPSTPSEAALVYGAAKALRNDGEAALAAKLLDDYARRYSHGALAEEALALSIDVSIARGDGRAKELAMRYLARYPHGHFRAKAERELTR